MPPIRKGDGTPVTAKGISQIRTGDGRILFDGPAPPDGVVYHWDVDNFADPWEDDVQNRTMSISGLSLSEGLVSSDGVDDFGSANVGDFGSILDSQMSLGVSISTTDSQGAILGVREDGLRLGLSVGDDAALTPNDASAGEVAFRVSDENGDIQDAYSDGTTVDDGQKHDILITKSGNEFDDVDIRIDGSLVNTNFVFDENPSNFVDFEEDMAFFAANNNGSLRDYIECGVERFTFYNEYLPDGEETFW